MNKSSKLKFSVKPAFNGFYQVDFDISDFDEWYKRERLTEIQKKMDKYNLFEEKIIRSSHKGGLTRNKIEKIKMITPVSQYYEILDGCMDSDYEKSKYCKGLLNEIWEAYLNLSKRDPEAPLGFSSKIGLHYFLGDTHYFITSITGEGETLGYTVLNGMVTCAEWSLIYFDYLKKAFLLELDMNVDQEKDTVGSMLQSRFPDFYTDEVISA